MIEIFTTEDIAKALKKTVRKNSIRLGDIFIRVKGGTFMVCTKTTSCEYNIHMFNGISMTFGKATFTIDKGHIYMSIHSNVEENIA